MTPLGEGDKKLNGFAKDFMEALLTLGLMTEIVDSGTHD